MLRLAVFVGILGSCSVCSFLSLAGEPPAHNRDAARLQSRSVSVDTSDVQDFDMNRQLHGVVKPAQIADLPSLVPGIIRDVYIAEGQSVKKGTPLLTLDDRVPRARLTAATVEASLTGALKRAEVELKMSENRLGRIRSVLLQGAGAQFELMEAKGARDQAAASVEQQKDNLKAAEANRQLAEAQLHQYTITAPFDGVITEIHRKSGAIDPSQVVVSIANLNMLEVEMHVPSNLFGRISRDDKVSLQASNPVTKTIDAVVVSVSPIINSASNTFRCLLQIENSDGRLPAGFSVVLRDSLNTKTNSRITLAP